MLTFMQMRDPLPAWLWYDANVIPWKKSVHLYINAQDRKGVSEI